MGEIFTSEIDDRGRVLVPRKSRNALKLKNTDLLELEIKKIKQKQSFVKKWRGSLKAKKSSIELLHEESPFR